MSDTLKIGHDQDEQRFFIDLDGDEAELSYSLPQEKVIDFTHTFVPEDMRGKGIAEKMAQAALTYARDNDYKIKTSCRFMTVYVSRHTEWDQMRQR